MPDILKIVRKQKKKIFGDQFKRIQVWFNGNAVRYNLKLCIKHLFPECPTNSMPHNLIKNISNTTCHGPTDSDIRFYVYSFVSLNIIRFKGS